MKKSTTAEIRDRFDQDVKRFSNLEKGQTATVDAVISLDILAKAALFTCPEASELLDVGCGAGNYSLKILQNLPNLNVTLLDLSLAMLEKAKERVSGATDGVVTIVQTDLLGYQSVENRFDIIVAGAVLHHLRDEEEWQKVFKDFYNALKPGGILLVSDLIVQTTKPLNRLMWKMYGNYLNELGGENYQKDVFEYIQKEDSPRSYEFQRDKLIEAGFDYVELLHKNMCFATFCALKEDPKQKFNILAAGETFS
jgi:tRNA (cmo5U34)-methyltransferase